MDYYVEQLSRKARSRRGEALGKFRNATVVDAIVMASAASRGDDFYTSDCDDLVRLCESFWGSVLSI
jgi:hypothetical protein